VELKQNQHHILNVAVRVILGRAALPLVVSEGGSEGKGEVESGGRLVFEGGGRVVGEGGRGGERGGEGGAKDR